MTKPLIRFLLPHSKVTSAPSGSPSPKSITAPFLESAQDSFEDSPKGVQRPSSIRALLMTPTHTVHYYWRKFDNAFMRPMFGGRGFVPFVPGTPAERSEHHLPRLQWEWWIKMYENTCTKHQMPSEDFSKREVCNVVVLFYLALVMYVAKLKH